MHSLVLGLLAGTGLLQIQAQLPTFTLIGWLFAAAVLLAWSARFAKPSAMRMSALFACGAAAGFSWAALHAHRYLDTELPAELESRDIVVVGTIGSLPNRFEHGMRFNFTVERAQMLDGAPLAIPPRIALSWYAGFDREDKRPDIEVQPGERWQFLVRLRRPHGNANPYGFDYEAWLLEQNLRATGTVRTGKQSAGVNRRLDAFAPGFSHAVERSRGWLRERILAALGGKEYAGVIVALVIGDQRGISQSDWKIFNRTGVGHLVSISGLHITMVAGLFALLLSALWRRSFFTSANLPLILPAQKAAALGGALIAFLYVLLAGFGVPAQRTLYMLAAVALALWVGRIASASHVLCLALAAVLLLDPWAVLWPGFWLSFAAVAVILYATVGRVRAYAPMEHEKKHGIKSHALQAVQKISLSPALVSASQTQYAVTLGLVPLTILLFGQTSLVSPIANAIAIPLVSFIVTPLALAGSVLPFPLGGWILNIAHWFIQALAAMLEWLSALAAAVWTAPIPSWPIFMLALIGTLWLLAPRGWPLRWIGAIAWLPLLLNVPARPQEEVWVTAFDVGQGAALLIETEHHRLLYDTGPFYSPESDGGSRVIVPYLKARGIDSLDAVIVSHNDNDHSGGALSVFGGMRVGWTASSLAQDSTIVRAAPMHHRCEAGQAWTWDGAHFEMLHPAAIHYESDEWKSNGKQNGKPNARSCTLKITFGSQSILLPGDIEAPQEAQLLATHAEKLKASVLLAPHHGSGTSSTEAFLRAVQPDIALFQVGYRNRYRHPKEEVFDRYGRLGIRRLRTDESGAITLRLGTALAATSYREEHARYWHGR